VLVLENIGHLYRGGLENAAEASRWYQTAADVMGAAASNGVPAANDPSHDAYLMLLNRVASQYLYALEDQEAAVPWLQTAARPVTPAPRSS